MLRTFRKAQLLSVGLAGLLWGACSDGGALSGAGGKSKTKDKDDKKSVTSKDDGSDDESEKSDQPVQIAGAFLSVDCGVATTETPSSLGKEVVGCAVVDTKTKAKTLVADAKVSDVAFTTVDGARVAPTMKDAAAGSKWHAIGELDKGTMAKVKRVDATLEAGGEKRVLKTKPGEVLAVPDGNVVDAGTAVKSVGGSESVAEAGTTSSESAVVLSNESLSEEPPDGWSGNRLEVGFDDWRESGDHTFEDVSLCLHGEMKLVNRKEIIANKDGRIFLRVAKDGASCGHRVNVKVKGVSVVELESESRGTARARPIEVTTGDVIEVEMTTTEIADCNPGEVKKHTDRSAAKLVVDRCTFDFHLDGDGKTFDGALNDILEQVYDQ